MKKTGEKYLLDTSAIFTLRCDEKGADIVENLLRKASEKKVNIYISFISFMEITYIVWKKQGEKEAKEIYNELKLLPIRRVGFNEDILIKAAEIKAKHKVSVADSWILSTAIYLNAKLLHKDPEFEKLKDVVKLINLPYK